jgi:hypothetical protein
MTKQEIVDRVIYSRAPMGLWFKIELPPPPPRWSLAWWTDQWDLFWFYHGRLARFLILWAFFTWVLWP